MASSDLRRLWKLHQVDAAIQDIRNRATNLNVGQKLTSEIEALGAKIANSDYRKLHAEQQDLELQQESIADKSGKFEGELYGGKIVNPREVENYEREIATLKARRAEIEGRILEIWDQLPAHQATHAKDEADLADKKRLLAETQKNAVALKSKLEADFKSNSALRIELAKDQNPSLLAKYEAIRKNHQGIGMAEVVKKRQCGACGTHLPERTLQGCLDDRTMTCETCHRILYYTEGVV
jgi:predicted  nucleic acid-binding Zn-ribbon protein